jgi:hypothetical protein
MPEPLVLFVALGTRVERSIMSFDWTSVAQFVQAVGIPFACLLLFVGPFLWLFFSLGRKYGPKIAEAHIDFMVSATKTQETNADTLAKLEATATKDQTSHYATHNAIGILAEAGIATLDGNHAEARTKLEKVETVLFQKT